ncbi:T9SS type A sorting domain-containing protein, partial [bacterium]|nr:T9SS type A sorting domain-containing protein [bacterium]
HLVKTDGFGDTLWTRRYGGSLEESANSVQQTTDGGYILAGHTWSFGAGSSDFYLVKTDSQGDTLWTRRYGGSGGDWASCVQQTADGGYILAGETQSFGTGSSGFLVKTNSSGDTIWTRFYGGVSVDGFSSIQQTADGGYIAAGRTWSYGVGTYDFYLVKTNSQGDTLWTRTFGGFFVDEAYSVQQTADGGYVVAGSTQSFGAGAPSRFNFYIVKTNSQGDSLWTRTYGDGLTWEVAYSVQQTTDGGYIIAGHRELSGIDEGGCWLIKTGPDQLDAEPIRVKTPNEYVLHPNLPNPFNASTQIIYELPRAGRVTLAVFNLLGEEVARLVDEVQVAGMHTVAFDGSGVASGVYLCRLQAEGRVQARKMVLLK